MTFIPVNTPTISESDQQAVLDCLKSGWISSEGPQVEIFEKCFAAQFDRNYGVAVSSGTAALDIVIRALGIGPGDEVMMPSLTIISCAQSVVATGATVVPVECDAADWNAHLAHFQARLTSRTRAIMLVHLYGLCADLDPILKWAAEHHLLVIEDGSQAQGLRYQGKRCGSFGDVSVFSLYANKLITTGEGGVIVCDDVALAERCRKLRNLCFEPAKRFWHEELGWNYRLTAMQAAIGTSQLARFDSLVARKRALGLTYYSAFRDIAAFSIAPSSTAYSENAYWVFGLVVTPNATFSRDDIIAALAEQGIGTRTFFYGLHQQPALLNHGLITPIELPITESLANQGFYLPSGLGLSDQDQQRVIDVVITFVNKHL